MTSIIDNVSNFDFGEEIQAVTGGGSRTFGQTIISWEPSSDESRVTITITLGGTIIKVQALTPNSNQLVYNGVSGQDSSKGAINASFDASGKSGSLYGDMKWVFQGDQGNYTGFIGSWDSSSHKKI